MLECITGKQSATSAVASLVITCEHGGNRIPMSYRELFRPYQALLDSHRGFDPGALIMARALAAAFDAPLLTSMVSRLLVDLNRSAGHPGLHLDAIRNLPAAIRKEIVEKHYRPYRAKAERLVTQGIARHGRVIHISCHSFTGNLNGVVRDADIGLLYDPARQEENGLCANWKSAFAVSAPGLKVRRNFPYEGRNDGLTSALRKKFPSNAYLGIELELNQKYLVAPPRHWTALRESVITALETALRGYNP